MQKAASKSKSDKKRQKEPKKEGSTTRPRQLVFLKAFLNQRFCIAAACRTAGIHRATFYRWEKSERFRRELDEAKQEKLDMIEAALYRNTQAGDSASIIYSLKTIGKSRGYLEGERVKTVEVPAKRAVEILDELLAGNIDVVAAALQFSREGLPLPEALRLLLSKTTPPEPEPEMPEAVSDAELEDRYQKQMAMVDKQKKEWVPERLEDVRAIKDELKDFSSFGPDAEQRKGTPPCQL